MSYRPLALAAALAALSSMHVASAAAQSVYVAPGGVYIGAGAGPVYVTPPAATNGAAAYVEPYAQGYGTAAYVEPGYDYGYGPDPYVAAGYADPYGSDPYAAPAYGYGYGYGARPYVAPRYGYGYAPRPYVAPRYGYGYGSRPYVAPRTSYGYGPVVPNRHNYVDHARRMQRRRRHVRRQPCPIGPVVALDDTVTDATYRTTVRFSNERLPPCAASFAQARLAVRLTRPR